MYHPPFAENGIVSIVRLTYEAKRKCRTLAFDKNVPFSESTTGGQGLQVDKDIAQGTLGAAARQEAYVVTHLDEQFAGLHLLREHREFETGIKANYRIRFSRAKHDQIAFKFYWKLAIYFL